MQVFSEIFEIYCAELVTVLELNAACNLLSVVICFHSSPVTSLQAISVQC